MNRPPLRQMIPHLLVVVVLAGIVIEGRRLGDTDAPALRVLSLPPCRLDLGSCRARVGESEWLDVSISPRPVPAGTPFSASLSTHGVTVRAVEIEFEGTDMNMGLFRQPLSPQADGHFRASVTLPVCATGTMRWQARLVVRTATETLVAPFELTTGSMPQSGA